jgi:hypothetical protein
VPTARGFRARDGLAVAMVFASVCVTSLAFVRFLLWALGSGFE